MGYMDGTVALPSNYPDDGGYDGDYIDCEECGETFDPESCLDPNCRLCDECFVEDCEDE